MDTILPRASDLCETVKCYEQNIAPIGKIVFDDMAAFVDDGLTEGLICAAIEKAVGMNKASWNYVSGILKSCQGQGIKTREAFLKEKKPAATGAVGEYDFDTIERKAVQKRMEGFL